MASNPKIVIIGAGAAGIAAAVRLIEKGMKNVLILEAKNRIGGRIHTVPYCKYSFEKIQRSFYCSENFFTLEIYMFLAENVIELGAQWCHGEENNIIYSLAAPHNLLESSTNINDPTKHIFVNSLGEVLSRQESLEIQRIYYKISDTLDKVNHKPESSYGDYFVEQ